MLDHTFKILALFGLLLLVFTAGAAVMYFQWPGHTSLSNSFEASKVLWSNILMEEVEDDSIPVLRENGASNFEKAIHTATVNVHEEGTWGNYTLITLITQDVYLIDMHGKPVRHWHIPFEKIWPDPTHVHSWVKRRLMIEQAALLPDGGLLVVFIGVNDTPQGHGLAKLDVNGNVVWRYDANMHHDFHIDSETGNIYALMHRVEKTMERVDFVRFPQVTDYVVVLSPDGKELDKYPLLPMLADVDQIKRGRSGKYGKVWDYMHTNSIVRLSAELAEKFPMFEKGYILVSMRNLNALAVIDPIRKKMVWFKQGPWKRQHSAIFTRDGRIMVFDNQGANKKRVKRKDITARIVAYDIATDKVAWEYDGSDFSMHSLKQGRVQELPNGNILIAESASQRLREVTRDKELVWSYAIDRKFKLGLILSATRYHADELPFLLP